MIPALVFGSIFTYALIVAFLYGYCFRRWPKQMEDTDGAYRIAPAVWPLSAIVILLAYTVVPVVKCAYRLGAREPVARSGQVYEPPSSSCVELDDAKREVEEICS